MATKTSRNHNYILYQVYTMSLINFLQYIVDLALEICVYGDSSNLIAHFFLATLLYIFIIPCSFMEV